MEQRQVLILPKVDKRNQIVFMEVSSQKFRPI